MEDSGCVYIKYGNSIDPASDMGTVISEYQAKIYLHGTHNNSLKMPGYFCAVP
jgi:hypothetical protein